MLNPTLFNAAMTIYFLATLLYALTLGLPNNRRVGQGATLAMLAGFILNTMAFTVRWMETYRLGFGYVPLSNMYESMVFFAWCIAGLYLFIEWKYQTRALGVLVAPLCMLSIAVVSLSDSIGNAITPLVPPLQSNWLTGHVVTCFVGYAAFTVGFAASVGYLLRKRWDKPWLPDAKLADQITYASATVGFPFLTLGILTGAIWANSAWGTYWSWDPKETWSLITWFIYAAYLHARYSPRWKGKQLAWLTVVGFGAVIFTYWGVNYLLPGLHSYVK